MCFFRKNSLDDYKTVDTIKKAVVTLSIQLRQKINICIIDDKKYPIDGLSKLGYINVDVHDKALDIEQYGKYQIILCDISGVASEISGKEEGLGFAKELQKMYPCTEVYLFTGQNVMNYGRPDGLPVIKKPKSNSELASYFDQSLKQLTNPEYVWGKIYNFLIQNNVRAKDIVQIEDSFVRAYSNGDKFDMPNLPNIQMKDTLSTIARFIGVFAATYTKEICTQ